MNDLVQRGIRGEFKRHLDAGEVEMNAEGVYRWVGKVMTESTVPPKEPAAEAKLTSEVVIADRENLPFHALAGILPMMTPAELNDLTEDFREHGLRDPIEIYDGQIVEGRNRFVALQSRRGPPEVHRAGGAGRCGRNAGTSTKASVPWLPNRIANMRRGDNQHASIEATSRSEAAETL